MTLIVSKTKNNGLFENEKRPKFDNVFDVEVAVMDGDRQQYRMMPPHVGAGGDVIPHVSGMPPAVASSLYGPASYPQHHHQIHHPHHQHNNMIYPHVGMLHDNSAFLPELPPTPHDDSRHEMRVGTFLEHHLKKRSRYDLAQAEITAETWRSTQELSMKVVEDRAKAAAANGERCAKHSSTDGAADDVGTIPASGKKRKNERCKSSVSSDAPPKVKKPRAPKGTRQPTKASMKAAAAAAAAAAVQQGSTPNADSRQESVHTPASSHAVTPTTTLMPNTIAAAAGGAKVKEESRLPPEFGGSTAAMLLSQPSQRYFTPAEQSGLPPLTKLPPFHSQFQPPSMHSSNLGGPPPNFGINSSVIAAGAAGIPAGSVRQHSDGNSVAPGSNNSSMSSNNASETFDDILCSMTVSSELCLFDVGQGLTCEDICRTLNPAVNMVNAVADEVQSNSAVIHQQGGANTPFSRPSSSSAANQQQQQLGSNNSSNSAATNRNNDRAASTSSNSSAIIHKSANFDGATLGAGNMVTAQDLDDCFNKLDPRILNPQQQPQQPMQNCQRFHDMYGLPESAHQQQVVSSPSAALLMQQQLSYSQHSYSQMPNPNIPPSQLPPIAALPPQISPGAGCLQPRGPPPANINNSSSQAGYSASRMFAVQQHHHHMMLANDPLYMQQHYPPPHAAAAARLAMPSQIQPPTTGMGPPPPNQTFQQHQFHPSQKPTAQNMYERTPLPHIPSSLQVGGNPKLGAAAGDGPPMYNEQHLTLQQQHQHLLYNEFSAREQLKQQQHIHSGAALSTQPPSGSSNHGASSSSSFPPQSSMPPGAKYEQQPQGAVAGGAPHPNSANVGIRQQHPQLLQQQQTAQYMQSLYGALPPGHPSSMQYLQQQQQLPEQQQQTLARTSAGAYGNMPQPHNLAYPHDHPANLGRAQQQQPQMTRLQQQQQQQQYQQFSANMMHRHSVPQQAAPGQRPAAAAPVDLNPAYMQYSAVGGPGRQPVAAAPPYGATVQQQQYPPPPSYAAGTHHHNMPPNYQPQPNNGSYYGSTGPPPPAASASGGGGQMPSHFSNNR